MADERLRSRDFFDSLPTHPNDADLAECAQGADVAKGPDEWPVICPRCCISTDSLKSYHVLQIYGILFFAVWQHVNIVGCPDCMRQYLARNAIVFIPLANFLYPVLAVFYYFQYLATYAHGHSDPVIADAHRMTRDEQFTLKKSKISLRKHSRKDMILVLIIVLMIAAVWGGGYIFKSMK